MIIILILAGGNVVPVQCGGQKVIVEQNERFGKRRTLTLTDDMLQSEELFSGGREITIVHKGENYKLRLTGNDRLILNK